MRFIAIVTIKFYECHFTTIMRIIQSILLLLYFVNLVKSSESDDIDIKVQENSWSNRIRKINRKHQTTIGMMLAKEDSTKHENRWLKEETEGSAIRYHPLGQISSVLKTENRFESQREHFIDSNKDKKIDNWKYTEPSPILLPPYVDSLNDDQKNTFYQAQSQWQNESSSMRKPSESFALEPIRVYEITTLKPLSDTSSEANYEDDSPKNLQRGDDQRWWDILPKPLVNKTETKQASQSRIGQNSPRAFSINDELSLLKGISNSRSAFVGRYNAINNSRGNRKYHHDFQPERIFMTKNYIDKYNWQRRTYSQQNNHFKFNSDTKIGAVPGIPGHDYPIHQEHTHLNLRNVANRFPCPNTLTTHIYLADRASRCQIFYVCYGSRTGVPMVCPNGTLFSDSLQVCDWWFNVSC